MIDISEALIKRLKKERNTEWEKGMLHATEFAKKSSYGKISRLATGCYNDEISKLPNIPDSETFIEGFIDGLNEILEKVDEDQ